ncbi:MAG: hypothetical protein HY926_10595 [Elusimicrobia bacterium]|nr:hypothetical protein [Elusimicrobiota bacterium]
MRKMLLLAGAAALAVVLWMPRAVQANCGHCDKDKAHAKAHSCLCKIAGAEKTVTNTPDGVAITFTSKDPAVVKQLQESAAKMKEGGCEKCTHKGDCKCPKCAKKAAKAETKREGKKEDKK